LIALHILILAWLSWRLFQRYGNSPVRLYYWPALGLKLLSGIALGLLYFVYYGGGDTLNYHDDAASLAALAWEDPAGYGKALLGEYPPALNLHYHQQERALLAAKIFSPLYVITGSNYWLSASYLSFLAFAAIFLLVHRLVSCRPVLKKAAPLAFLFWPSFVFWTSGLLKESLAMICIAYIVAAAVPYLTAAKRIRPLEALLALALFMPLFYIKYYYTGLLAPFLACLLLATWVGRRFQLHKLLVAGIFLFLLLAGVLLTTRLHPNMYAERFLEVWVDNYYLMAAASAEGNYVDFEGLEASWSSVLEHAPRAVLTGLYEPLFRFDLTNVLQLAAAAENTILLLLTILSLVGWVLQSRLGLTLNVFAIILYVLIFALVMGIAAPNFGAIVRYRISYQPFFTLLVLAGSGHFLQWMKGKAKRGRL
jgi:hypothetical protein